MSRYRFALRPAWLLSHALVLLLVVVLVNLGLWQLRRLDERQATNAQIEQRAQGEPVPLDSLVAPDDDTEVGDELRWERVVTTGTYDPAGQVFVRSRALDGNPGFWVLTPLVLDDGSALVVNRGWVPFRAETDASDVEVPTPAGPVTVTGLLQPSVSPAKVSDGGVNITVGHADLDWYDAHLQADVHPVLLQLEGQQPSQSGDLPVVLDPPDLSEGPHLGYAVQWFIFATIAVIGYPLVLRRVARTGGRVEDRAPPPGDADPASEAATPAGARG